MQDKTPAAIVCSKCAKIIIHAGLVPAMRERDINKFIEEHKCSIEIKTGKE